MSTQTFWQRTKFGSKAGFDKVYGWVDKLGPPVNRLSNKLGSEAFWPTTLDKESDKAARILRSFCKDGFYEEEVQNSTDGPKQKQKVLKKIPAEVIKNAKGLAIFTTMRTGLWISGAGGSGVVIARKEDGSWSQPSGIMLHTAGLGFLVGVDIYDCVVVINTQKALDAFSKIRCTLGGEVSAVAGPLGIGGILETELHKRQAPVFTYLKSRGFYAGVQIDGTVVIERTDENERFYNERIAASDILSGKVQHASFETKKLLETIRSAQGDTDVDDTLLPSDPAPGDFEIEASGHVFGVPDKEDPDPFGVLALEKQGLEIREAGTRQRPSTEQFNFAPSPRSPIFSTFNRHSIDTQSLNSRRASQMSNYDRVVSISMSDMSTQTDFDALAAAQRPGSGLNSNYARDSIQSRIVEENPEVDDTVRVAAITSPNNSKELQTEELESQPPTNGELQELKPEPVSSPQPVVSPKPVVSPEPIVSPQPVVLPESTGVKDSVKPAVSYKLDHHKDSVRPVSLAGLNGLKPNGLAIRPISLPAEQRKHDTPNGKPQTFDAVVPKNISPSLEQEESVERSASSVKSNNADLRVVTPNSRPTGNAQIAEAIVVEDLGSDDDLDDLSDGEDFDDVEIFEEPVVFQQVQTPPTAQTISRPRLVTVNNTAPPKLPPRSARRAQASIHGRPDVDRLSSTSSTSPADHESRMTPEPLVNGTSGDNPADDARASTASIGNSIAKLRAFDNDDDDENDDFQGEVHDKSHSIHNSHPNIPTNDTTERP